jgi:phosphoglycolate phosphatase
MRIILFDIDGTLIRSGGAGKIALHDALRSHFGVREILDRVNFAGRTDLGIGVDLLKLHSLEVTPENLRRLEESYLEHLPRALKSHRGMVLPGVVESLERLRRADHLHLGLLTGNVRRGAELKLRHYGLWDYFPFGGFSDGWHERDDVARHTLKEIEKHLGAPHGDAELWVIGDTPDDVKCARAIGAKAVGVLTGWHSRKEMAAAGADYLYQTLEEAGMLFEEWLKPVPVR